MNKKTRARSAGASWTFPAAENAGRERAVNVCGATLAMSVALSLPVMTRIAIGARGVSAVRTSTARIVYGLLLAIAGIGSRFLS